MTDQRIWAALQEMTERTGWPPSAVIDAVADEHALERDRVAQVWRERMTGMGAG
jgi:hypothetical protein